MADDDALFQKGMPIRREVLGPEYVDASMARADEFMMSFQRATTAWAWGWAWGDATLDRKTRSLINLAMLTALNRAPEIKLHVKARSTTALLSRRSRLPCCMRRPIAEFRPGSTPSGPRTKCWSARARCRKLGNERCRACHAARRSVPLAGTCGGEIASSLRSSR